MNTSSVEAESELRAALNGELASQLICCAPTGMVVIGSGGAIEFVNLQTERLLGYERGELLGQAIEVLLPEDPMSTHAEFRARLVAGPECSAVGSGRELLARRKDGSALAVEVSLSRFETSYGELVVGSIFDLTHRHAHERRILSLIESAPDSMVVVDQEGRIAIVNTQTERTFGYPRAELFGQSVDMLVPERLRAPHELHRSSFAHASVAREMGPDLEIYGLRRDGTEFPAEISLSPMPTDDGPWVAAVIRDVTARRGAEAAAQLASDRLLSAIETIGGTLTLYDSADRLVLCNSASRDLMTRGACDKVVGRTFGELLETSLKAELYDLGELPTAEFFARVMQYHRQPVGVLDLRMRHGQCLRITKCRTPEGGTVSVGWDITADVEREAALQQARAQAEAASSAKSEFLASMSHELRTPLNSILGFAQLLKRDKKQPLTARQLEKLDYVLKGGDHLLRLVDDVLDLSHVEAGHVAISLEPVGVAEVLSEVHATLMPMANRYSVALAIAPGPSPHVLADRTRLAQILINLGSNALKYGKSGGRAEFVVSERSAGFVRISVVDDGIGIPLDKQAKLFQPFQRAGQEAGPIEGTGIGLSISRRLAELMSGSVGFCSAPGQGSEFWVDLPRHQVEPSASLASSSALRGLGGDRVARYSVVYIEDNPSNVAFMRELLGELEQVSLIAVPTAEVGIELVRERLPDVVIMDINLPGMSGYEATRRLQEWPETKDIPIIAVTAAAMIGDRARAERAGFARYLAKPINVEELMLALDEVLASRARKPPMDH